jgi:hypothetical protein
MPIRDGVLIDNAELVNLPTSGPAWNAVLKVAKGSLGTPKIADMNSSHDLKLVGCALAAVKLNDIALKTKAHKALATAVGTEKNIRWLNIARNLTGYIVAADVLGVRSGPVFEWLKAFMTKQHPENNPPGALQTLQQNAWASGSNASAQAGLVHAALSVYLKDRAALDWSWMAFRRYCGDRTSTWRMGSNNDAWQAIPSDVVGIQNLGAVAKNGISISGAVSNDMVRSNPVPVFPLVWTEDSNYPWVGLNGAILTAEILFRQGYPAYEIADQALRRAATYLKNAGPKWYDATTRKDVKFLINKRYGVAYPLTLPVAASGLVGFTDWLYGS